MEYLILGNGAGMAEYSTPLCLAYNNCPGNGCPYMCYTNCPTYTIGCAKPGTAGMNPMSLGTQTRRIKVRCGSTPYLYDKDGEKYVEI